MNAKLIYAGSVNFWNTWYTIVDLKGTYQDMTLWKSKYFKIYEELIRFASNQITSSTSHRGTTPHVPKQSGIIYRLTLFNVSF